MTCNCRTYNTKLGGQLLMEGIGTAIFLMIIQLAVGSGTKAAPIAIGLGLMALVYAGGPISGAHYNPAISLAVCLRGGKQTFTEMFLYWIFQLVGGSFGAYVGGVVSGGTTNVVISSGNEVTSLQVALGEIIFTFMLCFVVLSVATHSSTAVMNNSYYGLAIGMTVTTGAFCVGPISGGAFNPAVALGLSVANQFTNIQYCLGVSLCNLIGGTVAACVFYLVAPDQYEDNDTDTDGTFQHDATTNTTGTTTITETTPLV